MNKFVVLVVAPFYPANAVRWLVDALERIGAIVIRVGSLYSDHMGLKWPKEDLPQIDIELPRFANWDLDSLIDKVTREYTSPTMLFVSEESYHNDIIPTKKVPTVLYSCDGWPENYNRIEIYNATTGFTNHPLGIDLHPRDEIDPRWQFLPGAAAPWVHKHLGLERHIDFCLLASFYGKRKYLCEELIKRNVKVHYGQSATPTYVDTYNRSITTFHNARPGEVKWRFWEAAAMGCINISGWSKLFAWLGYAPWHHYVPIETPDGNEWPAIDSLYETISFIRKNPALIKQVSSDARKRVLNQDTYYHRAKTILADLGFTNMGARADDAIERMLREELSRQ